MRIAIDMQGAQSQNRLRGIGRYTMALGKAMASLRGKHEVFLALNAAFSETIDPIRAAFADLLPLSNICVWEVAWPVGDSNRDNHARRKVAEAVREAFLANLDPDVVLVSSLFEGTGNAATSIGCLNTGITTAVILYDLIPFIHRNVYLQDAAVARWHMDKLEHLRRADLLLSISASVAREAAEWLHFGANRVVNISSAADSHFAPRIITEADLAHLRQAYGITRPYVMYTGGIDHRKNIEGLIRGFAQLARPLRMAHQLVVVCSIPEPDRVRLSKLALENDFGEDELVLTGYVSEHDMLTLYNGCALFVFPSWHEGFGLPVLEAMACGKAAIAANCSSLPEVVGREDALFTPRDDAAIAVKMAEVLGNATFRAELERHGLEQAKGFSWEASARRAWSALQDLVQARPKAHRVASHFAGLIRRRLRLAYVSPLPPEQTGIADYSAELVPELARHYDITVIVDQKQVQAPGVQAHATIHDVAWFRANAHCFEHVLYHFGNSVFHSHMFDLLAEIPGVVVLHDFFLSGIVAHLDMQARRPYIWARTLLAGHGWNTVRERFQANESADVVMAYPCNLTVVQQALGVIVHSFFSRTLARTFYGDSAPADWAVIPLLRAPAQGMDKAEARRNLGLGQDEFVVL